MGTCGPEVFEPGREIEAQGDTPGIGLATLFAPSSSVASPIPQILVWLGAAQVIFVLGGPGAGKETQCDPILKTFGYCHLSAEDLLRAEQASGTQEGEMIKTFIKEGKIVTVEATIRLLKKATEQSGNANF